MRPTLLRRKSYALQQRSTCAKREREARRKKIGGRQEERRPRDRETLGLRGNTDQVTAAV